MISARAAASRSTSSSRPTTPHTSRHTTLTSQPWNVLVSPTAAKALKRLSRTDQERLKTAIRKLPQGDVRILVGHAIWRLRVGDWRVLFEIDHEAKAIEVHDIRARGNAYGRLPD